ncbi:SprT-like domain-containing protein [Rhizobium sp. T1470]|uniref:SprT-like domain-containing protein n=1 Tax=unclassified Rhizobium TaxID=2613769 RepID=UPI001AAF80CA|nr:SprT-like domain-containing protein [Rhizobium sp. T1473]MCA0800438.1 SprT-like domain-containing protein [Rhizobium sp. T1473]
MNDLTPIPQTQTDALPLQIRPTKETYERLQQAYDHFNKGLFEGKLPNALITLQRRTGTFGYFAGQRFRNDDGREADEIALNPMHFASRSTKDILGTLVHEMVHEEQHHAGTAGRGRYHNREWADRMKAIGLHPSDTGVEGGREIGENVGHYIVEGGPFDVAADKLIARGFAIVWKNTPDELPAPTQGEGEAEPVAIPKSGKRVRYCCPECDLKAWAKHDVRLMCAEHQALMTAGD